jgi:hypothetical protein
MKGEGWEFVETEKGLQSLERILPTLLDEELRKLSYAGAHLWVAAAKELRGRPSERKRLEQARLEWIANGSHINQKTRPQAPEEEEGAC